MPKRDRTLFPTRAPMWRVRDVIDHLGKVSGVTEKLMAKGYHPPAPDTVQGWVTRNSIPGSWMPAVLGLAMDEQLIRHPEELLLKETM